MYIRPILYELLLMHTSHAANMNVLYLLTMLTCSGPGTTPFVPAPTSSLLTTPPASSTAPAVARKLIWSDEFETPGLPNTAKWNYDTGGHGFGNNELQFYTVNRPENARVENGKLIIETRKETYQNRAYTSAKIWTKGKVEWQGGRIEVRAKLPKGRGTWPAIWMLSAKNPMKWPLDGEIDIMEHVGFDEGVVHGTIHTEAYNHVKKTQKGKSTPVSDATQAFHVYAIDWDSERIAFYVDDQNYYTISKTETGTKYEQWPFDQPFYLILNVAVGGNWGGQKGVDDTIFPARMEVDYVRVYQ